MDSGTAGSLIFSFSVVEVEWNSTGSVASQVMSQVIGHVVGCWRLSVPVVQTETKTCFIRYGGLEAKSLDD